MSGSAPGGQTTSNQDQSASGSLKITLHKYYKDDKASKVFKSFETLQEHLKTPLKTFRESLINAKHLKKD